MQKNFKKLTALALAAVMAFSFANFPVYAEGIESTDDIVVEETPNEESAVAEETGDGDSAQMDTAVEESASTSATEQSEETDDTDSFLALPKTLAEIGKAVEAVNEIQTLASNAGDFNVESPDGDWSYRGNIIFINSSGTYTITGDGSEHSDYQITIGENITVDLTLSNVMISNSSSAAMDITNTATVTLYLEGDNSFSSGTNYAGIEFQGADTGSLTITTESDPNGALTATGGSNGAGIGGGYMGSGSYITISGGTVTATGGTYGAGIGGGYMGSGSYITITGGTVTATSSNGAGIGGGQNGSGSNITISGGTVTAAGDNTGAGIGGGYGGSGNDITISGGTVTATGGNANAADIGSGYNNSSSSNIVISNGSVKAANKSISVTPTNSSEDNVYLCTIPDMSGVNSVTVDNATYTRNGNHGSDGAFYLYLTGQNHEITANGTEYTAVWNSTSNSFTLVTHPSELTATYGDILSDVDLPTGWTWYNPDTSVGDAGTKAFDATYTSDDINVSAKISVTVEPATPEYTIPENLVATYGDKLSDVELPTGWTWDYPDTSVGNVGTNEFDATYTPDDTLNYSEVHAKISVTVEPATPGYTDGDNSGTGTTTGSDTSTGDDQTDDGDSSDTSTDDDQTGDTTSPQTGDSSNITLWIAVMLAAGAGLTGTILYSRKKKYSR